MDNAAAGGHPLTVAGADASLIAEIIAMVNASLGQESDGLNASVRMPGKAR
jgi:hypothetical protein